jgi:hypothetical protein
LPQLGFRIPRSDDSTPRFLRRSPSFEITTRTITKSVTFHRLFCLLKGVDRLLPPADYRVVTGEEVIEGLSFTAYHRISTVIFVPAEAGCAVEMMTMDLQAVHENDVAMLAVHSVVGRPMNSADS